MFFAIEYKKADHKSEPLYVLLQRLEIVGTVLADGADEVGRQRLALVNVAAYLADVSLFALGLLFGFGLDVVKIVLIGYGGNA